MNGPSLPKQTPQEMAAMPAGQAEVSAAAEAASTADARRQRAAIGLGMAALGVTVAAAGQTIYHIAPQTGLALNVVGTTLAGTGGLYSTGALNKRS